uniref:Alkyl transferase n=2 Tax=Tetraselmis sp. GSL018 TaxID=582737 RepID=A0A061SF59_9CHLO
MFEHSLFILELVKTTFLWFQNQASQLLKRIVLFILREGPVPRHVAFIMDGNRRFARGRLLSRAEGHREGYDRLVDALKWCLELGVKFVSVYAFSVENFKRSSEEVDDLMQLAVNKLEEILKERDLMEKHKVNVRVIGELGLLRPDVRRAAARVMSATRTNTGGVLNICFSYTSQHEMAGALRKAARGLREGILAEGDVTCRLLGRCLHTRGCPPVDLLVRTSGETRLSDFLLWQSGFAVLDFSPVLWPQFSLLDLAGAIAKYQRAAPALKELRRGSCCCCDGGSGGGDTALLGGSEKGAVSQRGEEAGADTQRRARTDAFLAMQDELLDEWIESNLVPG